MSQAVATTTNILQGVTGGARTVPGEASNLFLKQGDNGIRPAFDQHLAGQLGQSDMVQGATDPATINGKAIADGKLLPGNGNISPLPSRAPLPTPAGAHKTGIERLLLRDQETDLAEGPQVTPLYRLETLVNTEPSGQGALQGHRQASQMASTGPHSFQSGVNTSVSPGLVANQGQNAVRLAVNGQHLSDSLNTESQLPLPGDPRSDSMTQLSNADLKGLFSADYSTESSRNFRLYSQQPSLHGQSDIEHKLLNRIIESRSKVTTDLSASIDANTTGLMQSVQGSDGRPVPAFQINQPVTNPQWTDEFSDRVRWLVSGNIKKAEMSLTPKHLGTIDISITVHNDQTHISFNTQNHHSRDLVEASLGRLREMFDQAGLGNVDVDVSQHSDHRETASQDQFGEPRQNQSWPDGELVSTISESRSDRQRPTTLIDTYA